MNPFKITEPTCISFSGGRTSAYMLYKVLEAHQMSLPSEAIVCFANTGKEDEATLRFVQDCSVNWNVPIVWIEYQAAGETADRWRMVDFNTASRNGEPFEALIQKRNYLPNPVARFCTGELKVLTIERFFKSIGIEEFETMVGIRADEQRRVAKMRDIKLTPLASAGVAQADVQAFWKTQPFDLGLPFHNGVTASGNCDLCYLKGAAQVLSLIAEKPERAVWWAAQEKVIGGTFRSDRPSYAQMAKYASEQSDMFNPDEEGISCFCGD
jgi:3'-phosphoadenosine 5'-phosphosulfate sulfotransferase (PAPS reductase)/FAD synthetase